jgi:hypothetical protein
MTHSVKRLAATVAVLMAAGCASNPPVAKATSGATASDLAQGQAIPGSVAKDAGLTGEKIVALQHAGYRIVDKNGQKLYCSTDPKTGSRITKDNICMTEKELIALREETQRRMQNVTMQLPPPQGK